MSQELLARHSDERRLAAVLAGEIAPYARLVGHDAAQTPRDLDAHEDVVLLIIKFAARSSSAVRALECARHRERREHSNH